MRTISAVIVAVISLAFAVVLLLGGGFEKSGLLVKGFPEEEFFNYTIHFCAREDCAGVFSSAINGAQSVECAFYRIDDYVFGNVSGAATAVFVVDEKAKVGAEGNVQVFHADSKGIMHSKYCILDNRSVITGSFNPAKAAADDYNNVIVINSSMVAGFYSENFDVLVGAKQPYPMRKSVMLNDTLVEVYFCPYDGCVAAVKREIRRAKHSVVFAAYSFTHPEISNELILKASENVSVMGVMEKSGSGSGYSKYSAMSANGIGVRLESSKRLMHHKFFVIDNETVITGSFNPTRNAAERNDENVIIIHDSELAKLYSDEFGRISGSN